MNSFGMDNYIDLIKEGAEAWNSWRDNNQSTVVKIKCLSIGKGTLKDFNFESVEFIDVDFSSFNFVNCNLDITKFDNCNLAHSTFDTCKLVGANFSGSSLEGSRFNNCRIRDAKFSPDVKNTDYLVFENCDLSCSELCSLRFEHPSFKKCRLERTNFNSSAFKGAVFSGCVYYKTRFDETRITSSTSFKSENLISCNFSAARIDHTSFENADLRSCVFEGAVLRLKRVDIQNHVGAINFEGAKLQGVNFTKILVKRWDHMDEMERHLNDFSDIDLSGMDFTGALLPSSNFKRAKLNRVSFQDAKLSDCDFTESEVNAVNFSYADLSSVIFGNVDLTTAKLSGADLTKANLRSAKNFILDDNYTDRTKFPVIANDPWSKLRGSYSGPMFLLNMILLITFLTVYGGKVAFWYGINQAQQEILDVQKNINAVLKNYEAEIQNKESQDGALIIEAKLSVLKEVRYKITPITNLGLCLQPEQKCRTQSVFFAVIQWGYPWFPAILAMALIVYNMFRSFLTYRISILRDNEDKSQFSPSYNSYKRLFFLHKYLLTPLVFVSVASITYHSVRILFFTQVTLPP